MENIELAQQKEVLDYLEANKCQIVEVLEKGTDRNSKDLFLTIERLINTRIMFFEIPTIGYNSMSTIFVFDIIKDIYKKIKQN